MGAIDIKIGQVVKKNRKNRGLSQEALAELSSINRTYLGEIERGVAVPSIETLQKLADAFAMKLSTLIAEYEHLT